MKNTTITLAQRIEWTKFSLRAVTIDEVLDFIRIGMYSLSDQRLGNYTLKDITEAIRLQADETIQNEWKRLYVPVVTFNGEWDGHRISTYSNVTAFDFDHISSECEMQATMAKLKSLPYVLAIFRTFKKFRFKALILHDNSDATKHREMYEQVMGLFDLSQLDISCKDLSRKTYLAWDEEIWITPSPQPYHFIPVVGNSPVVNPNINIQFGKKPKSPQSIVNILMSSWKKNHQEYWQRGHRANSVFKCACQLCEYGVPKDMALELFMTGGWMDR